MSVQHAVMVVSSSAVMAAPGPSTFPAWCPHCHVSPGEPRRITGTLLPPGCLLPPPHSGYAAGRGSAAPVWRAWPSQASCGRWMWSDTPRSRGRRRAAPGRAEAMGTSAAAASPRSLHPDTAPRPVGTPGEAPHPDLKFCCRGGPP